MATNTTIATTATINSAAATTKLATTTAAAGKLPTVNLAMNFKILSDSCSKAATLSTCPRAVQP